MKLKEFEGKQILQEFGIAVPKSVLIKKLNDLDHATLIFPVIVKPQLLSGKRGKANLLHTASNLSEAKNAAVELLNSKLQGERIEELLIEENISHNAEYYISIGFSTATRSPVLLFSKHGGVDIEEMKDIVTIPINPLEMNAETISLIEQKTETPHLQEILSELYQAFETYNARLVEINPLIRHNDAWMALDAKIVLDDDALKNNPQQFPPRTGQRAATKLEIAARKIDEEDYRGVSGKSFLELDGDIAVLASGGGASLTCMDALLSYGGKPANYVEYSGNPSAEKVKQLTLITLSKPGLHGCWVVGVRANFTRIDETMKGFIEALEAIKPKYPIVIRRAGPGDKEAFSMLREAAAKHKWNMHLFDEDMPLTASAKILMQEVAKYKHEHSYR